MSDFSVNAKSLDTNQLMQLRGKLINVSKDTDGSIFSQVSSLDKVNVNGKLEAEEVSLQSLTSLGNGVLGKLMSMFGISAENKTENNEFKTEQDMYNDPIIQKYFKPVVDEACDIGSFDEAKSSAIKGMDDETQQYLMNSIKQEKLSQGAKIVREQEGKYIEFDDGSNLYQDNGVLSYHRHSSSGDLHVSAELKSSEGRQSGDYHYTVGTYSNEKGVAKKLKDGRTEITFKQPFEQHIDRQVSNSFSMSYDEDSASVQNYTDVRENGKWHVNGQENEWTKREINE